MLDFICGIGVTNLGHAHSKVSKAAADQCTQLVHAQVRFISAPFFACSTSGVVFQCSAGSQCMNIISGSSSDYSQKCTTLHSTRSSSGTLDPNRSGHQNGQSLHWKTEHRLNARFAFLYSLLTLSFLLTKFPSKVYIMVAHSVRWGLLEVRPSTRLVYTPSWYSNQFNSLRYSF